MKPLKLSMSAFGPYKEKEIIDFTKLHEHGIFVVSGSTGAGKTTIFDAITFALYDAGSGEDREKSLFLRSDFAEPTMDTEVELIFEVRGRIYRIWRKFGHDGASAKREFYDITGGKNEPAVEKFQVKLVQSKIEELIGLTQSQFNQIVMLPQGEFQKLLTSESKHKEEIFRKIFKTERFTKMVELLKDKKKLAENMYDQAKMQQDQTIYEIKNRLPERESELFATINGDAINMYQVEGALAVEEQHYVALAAELNIRYEALKKDLKQQNELYGEQKILNERIEKFKQRQIQLAELKQQEAHFESQAKQIELAIKASQITPLERDYERAKTQLSLAKESLERATTEQTNAQELLSHASKRYEEQQKQAHLIETYAKTISQLEQLLPIYRSMDDIKLAINKLEGEKIKVENLFDELTAEQKNLIERKTNQQVLIKQLEDGIVPYQKTFEEHAQLVQKIHNIKEAIQLNSIVQALQDEVSQKQEAAETAQQQVKQVEQQIRHNQAAFIASTLVSGEACPVCGSFEHPAVNNQETAAVEESVAEGLRKNAELAMQKYYEVKSKLDIDLGNLQLKQKQLDEQQVTIDSLFKNEQTTGELAQALQKMKQQQAQLVTEKHANEELMKQLDTLQTRIEKGRTYVTNVNTQLAQEQGKFEQSEKSMLPQFTTVQQVNAALQVEQLKHETLKGEIERATQHLQQAQLNEKTCAANFEHAKKREIDQLQEESKAKSEYLLALENAGFTDEVSYKKSILAIEVQQQMRQEIEQFRQKMHTFAVQIAEDSAQLAGKEPVDLTAWEQQINELNHQFEMLYADYKLAESYMEQCRSTKVRLQKVATEIEQYKGKLIQVEQIYDVIRGQNEAKISFERFAQIGYLEKVTHAANERLRILSNGQYFLKSTGRKEGNAQSGLSIDVFDSNTGQTRDVKTLSGGEKFNASLALALGMADVIQSVQGSVHIDTMFIDEGFGTLDEESLRKAIDILIDLQQTGRLIGVISHVAELKAAMPAILQVQKLKEGHSRTEIIIK
ncbi:ATPase [Solibacillus sp. R5-41]|uniref:AAA family ATPase n=1 Tax=Solibacillus sp. R5-41 TaxID=2048654 RepID=UPI000C128125|nr:SMC family ATPase [Solibacillus sp. R5-41]ATP41884.1 ATPase [Solibacillus sp. R5-41]